MTKGHRESPANKESLGRTASKASRGIKGQQVNKVHKESQACRGRLDLKEQPVNREPQENRARLDRRVLREPQACKV